MTQLSEMLEVTTVEMKKYGMVIQLKFTGDKESGNFPVELEAHDKEGFSINGKKINSASAYITLETAKKLQQYLESIAERKESIVEESVT